MDLQMAQYCNSGETIIVELYEQIADFFEETQLLPFGGIKDRIVSIIHPGEGLPALRLLEVLESVSEEDKKLLLKIVLLNDIFCVQKLNMYDWGYWVDIDGNKNIIPYGCYVMSDKHPNPNEYYKVFGVAPTISVLGSTYSDPLLREVRNEIVDKISSYISTLYKKSPDDVTSWNALDVLLRRGVNDLVKLIP